MSGLDTFKIDLKAIGVQDVTFDWRVGESFFAAIDASDIHGGDTEVKLVVHKKPDGCFELAFNATGFVVVQCDRCLDDMRQPIETEGILTARLGEVDSDDGDIVTVDADEGVIDVTWFVYELIALNLSIKHVHPEGECNGTMMEKLSRHSVDIDEDAAQDAVDSRWGILEKLIQ